MEIGPYNHFNLTFFPSGNKYKIACFQKAKMKLELACPLWGYDYLTHIGTIPIGLVRQF